MSTNKYICKHCKYPLGASCSDNHCHECATKCIVCDKKVCKKYNLYSQYCELGKKSGYAYECYSCGNTVCSKHRITCSDCSGEICDNCVGKHYKKCDICEEDNLCEDNGSICKSCKRFRCYDAGCAYDNCPCGAP